MNTIKYEYLGEQFVESNKGLTYINDNGDCVRGYYERVWMSGQETVKSSEVKQRVAILKKMENYRNVTVC